MQYLEIRKPAHVNVHRVCAWRVATTFFEKGSNPRSKAVGLSKFSNIGVSPTEMFFFFGSLQPAHWQRLGIAPETT